MGGALWSGIKVFITEVLGSLACLPFLAFCHVRTKSSPYCYLKTQQDSTIKETESKNPLSIKSVGTLILDLSAARTVKKKVFFIMNHPVYCILF